ARTEPAAEFAARIGRLLAERDAAEMGADAHNDEDGLVAFLHAGRVSLRIAQFLDVDGLGGIDIGRGAISHEHRLAAPYDGDVLALNEAGDAEFGGGKGQGVRCRVHAVDEGPYHHGRTDCAEGYCRV